MNLLAILQDKENKPFDPVVERRIKKDARAPALPKATKSLYAEDQALRKRRAFGDLSNRVQSKLAVNSLIKDKIKKKNALPQKVFNHNAYLEDEFALDDSADLSKTAKYTTLSYTNAHTNRTYKFYCFDERDLKVPAVISDKTISHTLDNDCSTDEGQVRGAIIKLFRNIESGLKERESLGHN